MLDLRVYRAAFAPLLLALVVAAFSLVDRPRPLTTTLAPDAFDGPRAFSTLQRLAGRFPERRPGDAGDMGVAASVERSLRGSFCNRGNGCSSVVVRRFEGETIDGKRTLESVVATRVGRPGPGIVVLAHRDAAGRNAEAELSGTAALVELGRVFGGRTTKRTLTLVSTSGGTGGVAGARQLAQELPAGDRDPDAVIVLGDLASQHLRKPIALPWSESAELAPVQLRRTAETAVKTETGEEAGDPHAFTEFSRLAFPFALGEQAPFNAVGVPAIELQSSGEQGPEAGAAVSAERLRLFGRAALRTIDALDNGPTLRAGPTREFAIRGLLVPPWAVRLLVAALLLPALLGAIDGLARVRRRHAPVSMWLRWVGALSVPFVAAAVLTRLLGATGLLEAAPNGPVVAGRIPVDGIALAVVALVFVLGWLAVAPLGRALGVRATPDGAGPAAAVALATVLLACAVWAFNPFAAAVLVLPAHLWLLVGAPEVRLRRWAAVAAALGALVPAAIVLGVYAHAVGASLFQLPWSLLLLVGGRQVGVLALLAICLLAGCAVGAVRLALRRGEEEAPAAPTPSIFGPLGHTGWSGPGYAPGSQSTVRARR